MPLSVEAARETLQLGPGDVALLNDPFQGGTHLPDITAVAPVFIDGASSASFFLANRAHHADVGGMAPGSMPPDATEIYQEGLRIPPVRWTHEVEALFLAASRTPDERRGDLDAQRGANRLGATRLRSLAPAPEVLDEIVAYGERRMRAALRSLPDGTYEFEDVLDSTGGRGEAVPARVAVRVTVVDDDGGLTTDTFLVIVLPIL
jgi:N-methylhydantoinase B